MDRLILLCATLVAVATLLALTKGCQLDYQYGLAMTEAGMCQRPGATTRNLWEPCQQTIRIVPGR